MDESIRIDLNSSTKSVLKVGLALRASVILCFVLGSAFLGIEFLKGSFIITLICFTISFGLFIIFFKILNSVFFKEYLIITTESITLFRKNLSGVKKFVFNLSDIKYFGFADQHYTKHPMDNPVIDFTGLATQEREMQYVIDEGNIMLETETQKIKFGKNIPSWDVEELVEKIEHFTGRKFASPKQQQAIEKPYVDEGSDLNVETLQEEVPDSNYKRYSYKCDEGELIIEQKEDTPSADDKAYLNGRPAPTGKYQIEEKKFVFISNGIVYAVRL